MIGVSNHLRKARYLGSTKPFSGSELGSWYSCCAFCLGSTLPSFAHLCYILCVVSLQWEMLQVPVALLPQMKSWGPKKDGLCQGFFWKPRFSCMYLLAGIVQQVVQIKQQLQQTDVAPNAASSWISLTSSELAAERAGCSTSMWLSQAQRSPRSQRSSHGLMRFAKKSHGWHKILDPFFYSRLWCIYLEGLLKPCSSG